MLTSLLIQFNIRIEKCMDRPFYVWFQVLDIGKSCKIIKENNKVAEILKKMLKMSKRRSYEKLFLFEICWKLHTLLFCLSKDTPWYSKAKIAIYQWYHFQNLPHPPVSSLSAELLCPRPSHSDRSSTPVFYINILRTDRDISNIF